MIPSTGRYSPGSTLDTTGVPSVQNVSRAGQLRPLRPTAGRA